MTFKHHELIGYVFLNQILRTIVVTKSTYVLLLSFMNYFNVVFQLFFLEQLLLQIEHFYGFSITSTAPTWSINDLLIDIFGDIYDYKFYICMISKFHKLFQIIFLKKTPISN